MKRGMTGSAARKSGVLILPAAQRNIGNALAELISWAPDSFSIALSPTGTEPVTHYACHAWAEQSYFGVFTASTKPARLTFTDFDYEEMRENLRFSVQSSLDDHLANAVAAENLLFVQSGR